ncbi:MULTISPECIES: polysaccharide deacetylase [unclassified Paenibacillus]|uniref:polysaccharide deacetylase n=1 Tax=unclassified Paenibacillus TaxID=185978 RepID=UPI001AE6C4CB|nr:MULTISPECIES: polysaccharide deacetylase [unclassified Paenibacillus]MBP1157500.1 peptidoglycan/xylan/chitin deacetylase (PgdA/CDA1 family) [Paenibacillus sp. PvP091]MBP1171763.1 peptidoglycan/xylan/chitin deacetylase (PgdA/CDA1 family) [Paenibacillus sp. PvR098]MBP2438144.1 peptidoglycan/xylan/chitin deacetylase (PgdA/CDA1 family) [Paenibacillus sp. PvP052]
MMRETRTFGCSRVVPVILRWLCLMLMFTSSPNIAGASESSYGDQEAVFAQLKAGKRMEAERTYSVPENATVYLTFDDGPSKLTPKVLDILRDEGVEATFFVLGEQAEARPEIVRRIVEEGHALGNHTYNHRYKELYSDFSGFWEQVLKTEDVLAAATGERPRLLRAPGGTFGNFDAFYYHYLSLAGYVVHDWNIDSEDARRPGMTAESIYRTVEKGPFRHEAIVLMHDKAGHEETIKALPRIIRLFKEKGYTFASLSPDVKPVQFSVSKPKRPRAVSMGQYEQLAVASRERGTQWSDKLDIRQAPQTLVADSGPAPGPERLRLRAERADVSLARPEFIYREGYYSVPIRQLSSLMGGRVEWNEETRTASVSRGLYKAEYDLALRELRVQRPAEEPQSISLPEMEVKDGVLYVPLRKTLELFGGRVTAYTAETDPGTAEVQISFSGRYGSWLGFYQNLKGTA